MKTFRVCKKTLTTFSKVFKPHLGNTASNASKKHLYQWQALNLPLVVLTCDWFVNEFVGQQKSDSRTTSVSCEMK